jgi:hypothetical protein
MTEEERSEKLAILQERQMAMVEISKMEDEEERRSAYEAMPEFTLTPEEIHEIYMG